MYITDSLIYITYIVFSPRVPDFISDNTTILVRYTYLCMDTTYMLMCSLLKFNVHLSYVRYRHNHLKVDAHMVVKLLYYYIYIV